MQCLTFTEIDKMPEDKLAEYVVSSLRATCDNPNDKKMAESYKYAYVSYHARFMNKEEKA